MNSWAAEPRSPIPPREGSEVACNRMPAARSKGMFYIVHLHRRGPLDFARGRLLCHTILTFESCADDVFLDLAVKADLQQVWLAAHLAIFYVLLRRAATIVDTDFVPLTAARTPKTRFN